jgi:Beta-galactosidase/Beta-galactosidase trimerisation domain
LEPVAVIRFKKRRPIVKTAMWSLVLRGLLCGTASADELVFPQPLETNRSAAIVYHFDTPATGHGFLDIEWRDVNGRVAERHRIPLHLIAASAVTFTLDLRRAAATKNQILAHLSFDQSNPSGPEIHRESDETQSFIVPPPDDPWSDYQIIMWQPQTPAAYATLKKLGITAGMVETNHRDQSVSYSAEYLARLTDADLRCYIENIASDFYAPYHKWYDNRSENWRYLEAKERYWANPLDLTAFFREPSLSDPQWLARVQERLVRIVGPLRPYRPLYYNLGDETGIADLSAFWDFDFSPTSLAAMRDWLEDRYESLAALNAQWGTAFNRWDDVMPMTTDEAMKRPDENFSAWADFKEWMDVAFARALKSGTDAIHVADPNAVAAIEGAQIPGWGGYDYSRLAGSVDAMELYDYGDNVEIARSFNPQIVTLTTSFETGPSEAHRVWRELLRGTRGLILWDDGNQFAGKDGNLGERGRAAASYFSEIRGGLGALLINSRRHIDPIGILYSPASMRVQWLLDRRVTGEQWSRRSASSEYQDDAIRRSTREFASVLAHMGLQPRFVSSKEVQRGELRTEGYRVLILPHAIALAPNEAKEIRNFVEHGGVVIADSEPGVFDEHGRKATKPLLSEVFDGPPTRSATHFAFGKGMAVYLSSDRRRAGTQRIRQIVAAAEVKSPFPLSQVDGQPAADVETRIYGNGKITLLALQRDYVAAARSDGRETVVLQLPRQSNIYAIRARQTLGNSDRIELDLDPIEPVLLALSEEQILPPSIEGPARTHLGETPEFHIRSDAGAERAIIHIDVIDPGGATIAPYSGNLLGAGPVVLKLIPLALNDKFGQWKLRATDMLSGATATAELRVEP